MSRRDQIQMTDEEVRRFIEASKTIILTTNGPGGYPHPMPMWFLRADDGSISITTYKSSQKVQNLRRDPRVSLLVESGDEYSELKGVVLYGSAEVIDDFETVVDTLIAASGQRNEPEIREALKKTASKRVVIRIKPERVVSWDHSKLGGTY
ncbi:MAG: TIGR03618 family F420-dependent PPOX class oxidoreductase [Deltaproteobacteria bacterium]|nr:MAG: TIGR03618 family F420-dependent PPOX class oxidoreductase [Deltaproteobacteria bacterium]